MWTQAYNPQCLTLTPLVRQYCYWPCSHKVGCRCWGQHCQQGYKGKADSWGNHSNQRRNLCRTALQSQACRCSPLGSVESFNMRKDVAGLQHNHTCTHTHTLHACTPTHACMYTCMHTHTHSLSHMHTHTLSLSKSQTHILTQSLTHANIHAHTKYFDTTCTLRSDRAFLLLLTPPPTPTIPHPSNKAMPTPQLTSPSSMRLSSGTHREVEVAVSRQLHGRQGMGDVWE